MNYKNILGYFLYILHEILPIIIIIILIISKNILLINFILLFLLLVLYQWYIFNTCLVNPIINWCFENNNKYSNLSTLQDYYEFDFFNSKIRIFRIIFSTFHLLLNFILIILCIVKINYLYNEKIKDYKKPKEQSLQ